MANLPVPAATDPLADFAVHINALSDAITAAISSKSVAYYAGNVTTNTNGEFVIPGITGVLSQCSGAFISDKASTPHLFNFVGAGPPGVAYARAYSRTGAPSVSTTLQVCVFAYGTPA